MALDVAMNLCTSKTSRVLICYIYIVLLASCVGTIEDKDPQVSKGGTENKVLPGFLGILSAKGVSDTSIEIYFDQGAAPGVNDFKLYVNESKTPIYISYKSLIQIQDRNYYLLSGLEPGTTYSLRMEEFDIANNLESSSFNTISVSTFGNATARFYGVERAYPVSGVAGQTTAKIEWIGAQNSENLLFPAMWDVDHYEIRWSSNYSLLFTPFASKASVSKTSTSSIQVVGGSGDKVYVNVRAIHRGYILNSSDPYYKADENTKVLEVSLSNPGGEIGALSKPSIVKANGLSGSTEFTASWAEVTGNHHGLFYCVKSLLMSCESYPSGINMGHFANSVPVGQNHLTHTMGVPNQTGLEFVLLVCKLNPCSAGFETIKSDSFDLVPEFPSFGGINKVIQPHKDELSKFSIMIEPASSIGHFENYQVHIAGLPYFKVNGGSVRPGNSAVLIPKNIVNSNPIVEIQQTDDGGSPVAFTTAVTPVVLTIDLQRDTPATSEANIDIVTLANVKLNLPGRVDFGGLQSCSVLGKDITIYWEEQPAGGVWNDYRIEMVVDGVSISDELVGDLNALSFTKSFDYGNQVQFYLIPSYLGGENPEWGDNRSEFVTCRVAPPTLKFDQWEDIKAIGPMELTDQPGLKTGTISKQAEWLDGTGLIVTGTPDTSFINNGGDSSNNGIVHFAFRDVTINGIAGTFLRDCADLGGGCVYEVHRSDNNGMSWSKLDKDITTFDLGSQLNPSWQLSDWVGSDIIHYTDYSVSSLDKTGSAENSLLYLYKIVPKVGGITYRFEDDDFQDHHIIQVILPPPNMALVHRWIANKDSCEVLGRSISKKKGFHYSCLFKGTGATSKARYYNSSAQDSSTDITNAQSNDAFVDIEGHLLVDRFELGCNANKESPASVIFEVHEDEGERYGLATTEPWYFSPLQFTQPDSSTEDFSFPVAQNIEANKYYILEGNRYDVLNIRAGTSYDIFYNYQSLFSDVINEDFNAPLNSQIRTKVNCSINFKGKLVKFNTPEVKSEQINNWVEMNHFSTYVRKNTMLQRLLFSYGEDSDVGSFMPLTLESVGANSKGVNIFLKTPSEFEDSATIRTSYIYSKENVDGIGNRKFEPAGLLSPDASLDAPLGQILATNRAGFEPIVGYNKISANELCGSFKVDLKLGASGEVLERQDKRLMQRREAIVSSQWAPYRLMDLDSSLPGKDEYNELVNPVDNSVRGCSAGVVGHAVHNNKFLNYQADRENCQSRYSLSNAVGNVSEVLLESLVCDRSKENYRIRSISSGASILLDDHEAHINFVLGAEPPFGGGAYYITSGTDRISFLYDPTKFQQEIEDTSESGVCVVDDYFLSLLNPYSSDLPPDHENTVLSKEFKSLTDGSDYSGAKREMRMGMLNQKSGRFFQSEVGSGAVPMFAPLTATNVLDTKTDEVFNPIVGFTIFDNDREDLAGDDYAPKFRDAFINSAPVILSNSLTALQTAQIIDVSSAKKRNYIALDDSFSDPPFVEMRHFMPEAEGAVVNRVMLDYTMPTTHINFDEGLHYTSDGVTPWKKAVELQMYHGSAHNNGAKSSYSLRLDSSSNSNPYGGIRCAVKFTID